MRTTFALVLAALVAVPAGAAPVRRAPAAKPPGVDWTQTVARTPDGGYRMGNPDAAVKLVEYGSLTCPHCAAFSKEADVPLLGYVRTGKVSYEYRNFVLNAVDLSASLLARCAPPRRFFALVHRVYLTQSQWLPKLDALSDADKAAIDALPAQDRYARVAQATGLMQLAASYGLTADAARQCMRDPKQSDALARLAQAGGAAGVTGTPSFFVNGQLLDGNTWTSVQAALRKAGA